jgi:hypothetical protein
MKPKPFKINGNWDAHASVFKVFYGRKYIIMKAKNQIQALQTLENSIASYHRGNEPNPEGMYYHLILYTKKNKKLTFRVETILGEHRGGEQGLVIPSGYELLVAEQTLLNQSRKDKNCLNNNTDAYIPAFNDDTGMYGWLTKGEVLNFHNWKNKNPS